ncbi:MAG: flagellar basal-body rod protein FlgG [Chloroflexi bacterium]|nr:flagellar basal-body rod protein FlgG [Chloroflexota bacterium]
MWTILRTAASGAAAQQRALDVASNNLANLQTTGYKSRRPDFVEVRPREAEFGTRGERSAIDRELGQGVGVAAIVANHSTGATQETGQPLDLAITGDGYLRVALADGRVAYTRDGALRIDGDGRLVTAAGALIDPPITVPDGATDVQIGSDGRVFARVDGELTEIGQLELTRFVNPDGLESIGSSMFVGGPASGESVTGFPGEAGFGTLFSGALEASNVNPADEFVRVLQAQRAYQVNLRVVRTVDEMMQAANNLRR